MVWREQKNHSDDFFFCCSIDVSGHNSKDKKSIADANLTPADCPVNLVKVNRVLMSSNVLQKI